MIDIGLVRLFPKQWHKNGHEAVKLQCQIVLRKDFVDILKNQMLRNSLEKFYHYSTRYILQTLDIFGYPDKIDLKDGNY